MDFSKIRKKLCLGVKGKGNYYYELGTNKKVFTNKVKKLPIGNYIKPDFTNLKHQEVADYFNISKEEWLDIYFGAYK